MQGEKWTRCKTGSGIRANLLVIGNTRQKSRTLLLRFPLTKTSTKALLASLLPQLQIRVVGLEGAIEEVHQEGEGEAGEVQRQHRLGAYSKM